MSGSNVNIIGTDGGVPIYQPEARWCFWGLHEIYQGQEGTQRYIPKVNDYVIDHETYTVYKVVSINPVTWIPELQETRPSWLPWTFNEDDILFGLSPGTASDTFKLYFDDTVQPYDCAVDFRYRAPGIDTRYVKFYAKSDSSDRGEVISRVYDTSGNFISDSVGLELIESDSHTTYNWRIINVFKTTRHLKDGEIILGVFYNDRGHVIHKRQFIVENTSFIRRVNSEQKYITHIGLDNPFISDTDSHRIEFPLNIPLNALNTWGVVYYTDGTSIRLPVDNTKFSLLGSDTILSTIVGERHDLVLRYRLSQNESSIHLTTHDNNFLTEDYKLFVSNPNNAYSVKLYGYPVWMGSGFGYKMQWFLYNLDRNVVFDVTDKVYFAINGEIFDPKAYGYVQRRTVCVNLKEVSPSFRPYIHTQVVNIELVQPYNERNTCWRMLNEQGAGKLSYGQDLFAIRDPNGKIKIDCGYTSLDEWLEVTYDRTYSLVNKAYETKPPRPTHIELIHKNSIRRYSIDDYNKLLLENVSTSPGDTVFIKFIKIGIPNDIHLSIAAMIISS